MLRGNYPARIDDKGRLKLPAAFLPALIESGRDVFVTSVTGDFVRVYPMASWTEIEKRLSAVPQSLPARQRFIERVSYFGQALMIDAQGRIVIPPMLRASASMAGEVAVLGLQNHIAVWNKKRLDERLFKTAPFTDDDASRLAEHGI